MRYTTCGTGYTLNYVTGNCEVWLNKLTLYQPLNGQMPPIQSSGQPDNQCQLGKPEFEDNDECAHGQHNCDALGSGYFCRNTQVLIHRGEPTDRFKTSYWSEITCVIG